MAGLAPWLDNLPPWSRFILVAGGVAVIGALHPTIGAWVFARLAAISGRPLDIPSPPWGRAVVTVIAYVPAWLLIGTVSWALGMALGFDVAPVALVGATVAAWLAGFLAIPVPGGAGVREAVFVLLCGLPRAEAAAIAVAARRLRRGGRGRLRRLGPGPAVAAGLHRRVVPAGTRQSDPINDRVT